MALGEHPLILDFFAKKQISLAAILEAQLDEP